MWGVLLPVGRQYAFNDRFLNGAEGFTGLKMFAGRQSEATNYLNHHHAEGKVCLAMTTSNQICTVSSDALSLLVHCLYLPWPWQYFRAQQGQSNIYSVHSRIECSCWHRFLQSEKLYNKQCYAGCCHSWFWCLWSGSYGSGPQSWRTVNYSCDQRKEQARASSVALPIQFPCLTILARSLDSAFFLLGDLPSRLSCSQWQMQLQCKHFPFLGSPRARLGLSSL